MQLKVIFLVPGVDTHSGPMALTNCEIGLIVAVGVLAFIVMLTMLRSHSSSCRSLLSSCAASLTGGARSEAFAPVNEPLTQMPDEDPLMMGGASEPSLQGPMASIADIIDLEGGLPGAAAMEDFGEGFADMMGGLGTLEDAPHGDMMPSAAASGDLYSYADNLIPMSAEDPATIYSAAGMSGARSAAATVVGQSVGSAAVGRFEIGRRPEDQQGAAFMLRNANTETDSAERAYFMSQCRSICLPHGHPDAWPRGQEIPSGLASRCGPCTNYV